MDMRAVLDTFFPKVCATCEIVLLKTEEVVCTECLYKLPVIPQAEAEEMVKEHFYGRVEIAHAASLLYYQKKSLTQHLIHRLKYRGDERVSGFLGEWLGNFIKEEKWTENIDLVIPVPLHRNRLRKRGYNQVTNFAKSLAKLIEAKFSENILIKSFDSRTQVFKDRFARTELKGAYFTIKNPEKISGKRILLVDDIITTGSTMETCVKTLSEGNPSEISLATMALTV